MTTPFRIDILDPNDNVTGVLLTATSLKDERCLDKIGSASFSFPANDETGALITAGSKFDIYDIFDGYLGRYYFADKSITHSDGIGTISINCKDQLVELTRVSVRFRREYEGVDVSAVVGDLVSIAGWTSNNEGSIGDTTVTYEGESVLGALDVLRDRWGRHFRFGLVDSQLEFGSFGDASGVRLINAHGVIQADFAAHPEIAFVDTIKESTDGEEIFNRIIALGGGQGAAQLTMQLADYVGSYAIASRANGDGTLQYYIEDSASLVAYGARERVLSTSQITPVSNGTAAKIAAANALKHFAEIYLTRHKDPRVEYAVSVVGLRETVRVGDTVRLAYQSTTPEGYRPIDVNDDFYVMDITRTRDVQGNRIANMNLASVSLRRTSDTDVMIGQVNDLRAMGIYKQPFPAPIIYHDTDFIQGGFFANRQIYPTFTFSIDESITNVFVLKLRLQTDPLFSIFGVNVSLWGTAGTSMPAVYRLIKSPVYPRNLTIWVNGVDVTTDLYGSAEIAGGSAVDELFDITTLITEDAADIHQVHTIQIKCDTDSTSTATNIPDYTTTNELGVSFGRVTIDINGIGSSQALISY